MRDFISMIGFLSLSFSVALTGCSSQTADTPKSEDHASNSSIDEDRKLNDTLNSAHKVDLAAIYTQAIGDYIRAVKDEYDLTFDTLFFGRRKNDQPDDFPDIDLPLIIENTQIRIITPEQGEIIQKERSNSFYINLMGWANIVMADFIFVTFSDGFAHQFDFYINYKYVANSNEYVIETSRFEEFRFKKR